MQTEQEIIKHLSDLINIKEQLNEFDIKSEEILEAKIKTITWILKK
jgi:hypothetical protein